MSTKSKGWRSLAISALFAVGIATTLATGGSDGDGGSWTSGPTLPIDAGNAPLVSSALVVAIGVTFDIGDMTRNDIPIQAGGLRISMAKAASADGLLASMSAVEAPDISECINGGTVDVSYTLADPNTLTVGDSIVAVFDNCDNDDGYVISGTVDMTVAAIEGDIFSDIFLLAFDVVMTDILLYDGTDTATVAGVFTMTLDSLEFPVIGLNIAGSELSFGSNGEPLVLTDFDHDLRVDFGVVPEAIIAHVSGTLESALLGGSVNYETPVAIEASDDLDPHSGEILITGANRSSVRIVIVDSSHVTLEVDANGDGVIDSYIDTNWAELNGRTSTINSSTAPVLAREVYNAVTGFGSVSTAPGTQFTTNAPFDQVDQLNVTGDFGPLEIPCVISGIATVTGSKVAADGYTSGDQLAATFAACARAAEVLEGDMTFTVDTFSRTATNVFVVTGSVTETGLTRTMGGSCFTGAGAFQTSYDSMSTSTGIVHVEAFANSFDISAGGRSQHLIEAGNSADIAVGQQPAMVTRTSSGRLTSADLDGSFHYETESPALFYLDTDPATGPYSGELLVTADDGSTMRMVALDELTLRLDIDLDGDLIVDEQIDTTWATLAYDDWMCP